MLKYIQSISIFLIMQSAISANELSPNEILEKAIKRIDGIDHEMQIQIKSKDKNNKLEKTNLQISVLWQLDQDKYKLIHIKEKPKGKKKGRQLWVHTFKDGKEKKWIRMPRSGKIKDLTGKKSSQKVDLSSITMPLSLLKKDLSFLKDDVINGVSCKIVKVKNKSGYILFWIDPIDYIVHKKQFFDKESKLQKEVLYSELSDSGDIKFYTQEIIKNKKKNSIVEIFVTEFEKKTHEDVNLFNIPLKK